MKTPSGKVQKGDKIKMKTCFQTLILLITDKTFMVLRIFVTYLYMTVPRVKWNSFFLCTYFGNNLQNDCYLSDKYCIFTFLENHQEPPRNWFDTISNVELILRSVGFSWGNCRFGISWIFTGGLMWLMWLRKLC